MRNTNNVSGGEFFNLSNVSESEIVTRLGQPSFGYIHSSVDVLKAVTKSEDEQKVKPSIQV